jgi:hypothetical protein
LYYAIPIVAVLVIATAFVFAYILPPPSDVAMSFDVTVEIQVAVNSTASRLVAPPEVGIPGGSWHINTYNIYGVSGNYPVYTSAGPDTSGFSTIHVRSRVRLNYTLGDFFDVWGQPLGPTNTISVQADGTRSIWQMCVGVTGSVPTALGNWRSEVLTPNKEIIMVYYYTGGSQTGCL